MIGKNQDPSIGAQTQFQPGQSGNPEGKPKGSKHISTYIRELMDDETFEANILDSKQGIREYKGAPLKAIVQVATQRALNDPKNGQRWADWLAKYGYGTSVDITSGGEKITPILGGLSAVLPDDGDQETS